MEIESLQIFVKVVSLGSFTRAAIYLKLPKSTISRAISSLEYECGTKLLFRTTRSLSLTGTGRELYDQCMSAVQILENAKKSLYGADDLLTARIKLTASEDFGTQIISPAIGALVREHKNLSFEMYYTDKVVDLVKEGFDIAIRIGKLGPSNFKAKRVGEIIMVPVASKEYIKNLQAIKSPSDVTKLDCLSFSSVSKHKWFFKNGNKKAEVTFKPKITVNQMTSLKNLALEGAGIAMVPLFLCKDEIRSGKLTRVLTEWTGETMPVSIVSTFGTHAAMRLRLLTDHLTFAIRDGLA